MLSISNIILAITTLTTALVAGLLFGYACSVNPGLAKLPDEQYIAAMQSINRVIQNPVFFSCFFGTLFLLPYCVYLQYGQGLSTRCTLLLVATIIYAFAVIGITVFGNVPLNETLNNFDPGSASKENMGAARAAFEKPWNILHLIRTFFSIVTLLLTIVCCLYKEIKK